MRRVRVVWLVSLLAIAGLLMNATLAQAAPRELTRSRMLSSESLAAARIARLEKRIPARRYTYLAKTRTWQTCGPHVWASGYMPGELWLSYQLNGNTWYRKRAVSRQYGITRLSTTSSALDIGQRYYYSLARAYDMTGTKHFRNVALAAARQQAARYNGAVGAVRSLNTTATFDVIVDELMNTQLLFWGARHGGPSSWRWIARKHALTAARDFVRSDGSTYQLVSYDPGTGEVVSRRTIQGYSSDSTWARGQAWAIYGFATAYRETRDKRLLQAARRVASHFIAEQPADCVPYWDFDDPDIPNALKDSSAAAIAASGLIELATVETSRARVNADVSMARRILSSLSSSAYRSSVNTMLLRRGLLNYWTPGAQNCALSFGDYFYFEALLRLRRLPSMTSPLRVKRLKASKGRPKRAMDKNRRTTWPARGKQWIQMDLGRRRSVSAVGIAVRYGSSRSAGFKVRTSKDGKHWRTACRVRSSAETTGLERYDFATTRARYVRIHCHGSTRSSTVRLAEIRAY